jgi:murein DD-endopeptidase MepM/ murein hydrolase activator NlpD
MMSIFTILLFMEYRFFKQQSEQLVMLKEDYQNHLMAVNKMLQDYNKTRERLETLESEKKKSDSITSSSPFPVGVRVFSTDDDQMTKDAFVVINRELDYLKQASLSYLKKHDAKILARIDQQEWRDYTDHLLDSQRQHTRDFSKQRRRYARGRRRRQMGVHDVLERRPSDSSPSDIEFAWPIKRSDFWLSSFFGPRRRSNGAPGFHYGIDLAAVRGTPVHSAAAGVVVEARYAVGYGKTVLVAHNRKYKTRYAHLDKILVKPGQKITAAMVLGRVGSTGHVRSKWGRNGGSHLHFEVYTYGKKVNPMYFFA